MCRKLSLANGCFDSTKSDAALARHQMGLGFLNLLFRLSSPVRRRVAQAGQGILTNMFEHVAA